MQGDLTEDRSDQVNDRPAALSVRLCPRKGGCGFGLDLV